MQPIRASYQRPLSFLSACFFSQLLVLTQIVSAADQASHAALPEKAGKMPKASSPALLTADVTEEAALASFDTFTQEWMHKLSQTEEFQRTQRKKVIQSTVGFSAEYIQYLPHRYIMVKKTQSQETPFIGILTYFEETLQSSGQTKEQALQGPFNAINTKQVSEIFRFTKGKWVY